MSLGTGIRLADLIAAICFIFALRGLSNPKGARRGNLIGAAGMVVAAALTFATRGLSHFALIVIAMAVGRVTARPAAPPPHKTPTRTQAPPPPLGSSRSAT